MTNAPNDFAALARQYWGLWSDALQDAVPQTEQVPGTQAFREALNAWTQAAGGGQGGFDSVLGHVRQQSGDGWRSCSNWRRSLPGVSTVHAISCRLGGKCWVTTRSRICCTACAGQA